MNRLTIRQRVTASISNLKAMTHTQLKAWETANEMEHERLIGSIRRECIDHVVVFGERHLRHVLLS